MGNTLNEEECNKILNTEPTTVQETHCIKGYLLSKEEQLELARNILESRKNSTIK